MDFWLIIYIIDWFLFGIIALTVLYLTIFAIAGMFSRHPNIPKSRHLNRFIVLIPSYQGNKGAIETVMAVLGQSYPQRLFDVTVISEHEDEMTNFRLAQYPITLLTPNFENSSKARSLQFAVNNLPQFKLYDIVVVLDAGTIVDQEFLQEINDAYEVSGTKAIQAHRLSKNRDTAIAHMDAVFEEINNTIFRRGHITLGLSSSLSGSGNAFSFEWFKDNIYKIKSSAYTKEMEALLLRQHIFVDYFDEILVYDEKKRETKEFNDQRAHWASTQFYSLIKNIRFLPMAIFNRYYAVDSSHHYDGDNGSYEHYLTAHLFYLSYQMVDSFCICHVYLCFINPRLFGGQELEQILCESTIHSDFFPVQSNQNVSGKQTQQEQKGE